MKKAIAMFILITLITCGISYSVTAFSHNKNSQSTSMNEPLTLRAEVAKIGDSNRIFSLRAYATNTWAEQITVHWNIPCLFGVFYLAPNTTKWLLINEPFKSNIFRFKHTTITFQPGEEKLVQKAMFFGTSNWILPSLARGYQQYIPNFLKLPDGDYQFQASLNAYRLDSGVWYPTYLFDAVYFHFGPL